MQKTAEVEWEMRGGLREKKLHRAFCLVRSLSGLNATRAFAAKDGRRDGEEIQMRSLTKKCGVGEVAAKTDN